jgi:hypothetical protein
MKMQDLWKVLYEWFGERIYWDPEYFLINKLIPSRLIMYFVPKEYAGALIPFAFACGPIVGGNVYAAGPGPFALAAMGISVVVRDTFPSFNKGNSSDSLISFFIYNKKSIANDVFIS